MSGVDKIKRLVNGDNPATHMAKKTDAELNRMPVLPVRGSFEDKNPIISRSTGPVLPQDALPKTNETN